MICIKCGHQNPEGAAFCQSCNSALPKIPENVATPIKPRISGHLNQLKEVGKGILAGEITQEDFQGILERIYNTISERAREIQEMEIPEEIRPGLQDQLEVGFSGINLFMQAIDEMRLYLENQSEEHVNAGLELAEQGNEKLNLALEMNRENIRRLKEMDMDTSPVV
ncbi:MAG: zinc ribbon domain-containing protein [Armatimonadetes bacterium]|nr:zinc ribbon domain-containing protein [Armatimonadota bacterium]